MKDNKSTPVSETSRLEQLWGGEFGDAYVERNREAGNVREPFWCSLLEKYSIKSVLEVGCNVGANLRWIATKCLPDQVYGIDVNQKALQELRRTLPTINSLSGHARELPFRDKYFDLVFTTGVLIHQPDTTLPLVMAEIVRCSRKYVLCGEYFSETSLEVPYRNQRGALFKRNYGAIYQELFPELTLVETGFLGTDQGWDDVTYWVFQNSG